MGGGGVKNYQKMRDVIYGRPPNQKRNLKKKALKSNSFFEMAEFLQYWKKQMNLYIVAF